MRGTALIFRPGKSEPEIVRFTQAPGLDFLQAAVGGYIEVVPHFDNIRHGEVVERCVAFCNEHGKLNRLPVNRAATEAWERAVPTGLRGPLGYWLDFLVGDVVVLFGDREFMAEL